MVITSILASLTGSLSRHCILIPFELHMIHVHVRLVPSSNLMIRGHSASCSAPNHLCWLMLFTSPALIILHGWALGAICSHPFEKSGWSTSKMISFKFPTSTRVPLFLRLQRMSRMPNWYSGIVHEGITLECSRCASNPTSRPSIIRQPTASTSRMDYGWNVYLPLSFPQETLRSLRVGLLKPFLLGCKCLSLKWEGESKFSWFDLLWPERSLSLWLWWAKGYYRNHSPFSTDCNRWSFSRQVVTCPHMAVLVFSSIFRIILIKRISSLLLNSHILVCLIDFKKSCCFILLTASQWYTYTWIYILENAIINTVTKYSKSYNIQKINNHRSCVQHETWNRTLTCDSVCLIAF